MGRKKGFSGKKLAAAITLAGISGGLLMLSGNGRKPYPVPAYTATRILDGDTFETAEKQLIRLSGVDAPELGVCGGEEAKEALGKLIKGKALYIKIVYRDQYNRLNGLVYAEGKSVNEMMLEQGRAMLNDRDNLDIPEFQEATNKARKERIGIFSSKCTQKTNTANPSCIIKGNNHETSGGNKYFHLPGCPKYEVTEMQLYLGDRWFCTESDALKAGYMKPKDCP